MKYKANYNYVIDLNERGMFSCHVECKVSNKIIWEASTEGNDDGEFWPVVDGFMKDIKDMKGLKDYLVSLRIISPCSSLHYIG